MEQVEATAKRVGKTELFAFGKALSANAQTPFADGLQKVACRVYEREAFGGLRLDVALVASSKATSRPSRSKRCAWLCTHNYNLV